MCVVRDSVWHFSHSSDYSWNIVWFMKRKEKNLMKVMIEMWLSGTPVYMDIRRNMLNFCSQLIYRQCFYGHCYDYPLLNCYQHGRRSRFFQLWENIKMSPQYYHVLLGGTVRDRPSPPLKNSKDSFFWILLYLPELKGDLCPCLSVAKYFWFLSVEKEGGMHIWTIWLISGRSCQSISSFSVFVKSWSLWTDFFICLNIMKEARHSWNQTLPFKTCTNIIGM